MRRFTLITLVLALVLALLATLVPAAAVDADTGRRCARGWGSLPEASSDTTTAVLDKVRIGRHPCFDRIVLVVDGGDAPGYRVEYVKRVREDGSGNPVRVRGGAKLRIIVTAPAHDDDFNPTIRPRRVDRLDTTGFRTFRDVAWAGSFEGQTTIGLGVRARLPFRVFTLDGPGDGARVVIDVAHRW